MSTKYDLHERCFAFAESIRDFLKCIPYTVANKEYTKQLVRSSGSVAANYLEADEGSSVQEQIYRFRVSKKEDRESSLWLRLIEKLNAESSKKRTELLQESNQLVLILAAIIRNRQANTKQSTLRFRV